MSKQFSTLMFLITILAIFSVTSITPNNEEPPQKNCTFSDNEKVRVKRNELLLDGIILKQTKHEYNECWYTVEVLIPDLQCGWDSCKDTGRIDHVVIDFTQDDIFATKQGDKER